MFLYKTYSKIKSHQKTVSFGESHIMFRTITIQQLDSQNKVIEEEEETGIAINLRLADLDDVDYVLELIDESIADYNEHPFRTYSKRIDDYVLIIKATDQGIFGLEFDVVYRLSDDITGLRTDDFNQYTDTLVSYYGDNNK